MWITLIRTHHFTKCGSVSIPNYFKLVTAYWLFQARRENEQSINFVCFYDFFIGFVNNSADLVSI